MQGRLFVSAQITHMFGFEKFKAPKERGIDMSSMSESFKNMDYLLTTGHLGKVIHEDPEGTVVYEVSDDISKANWFSNLHQELPDIVLTSEQSPDNPNKYHVTLTAKQLEEL